MAFSWYQLILEVYLAYNNISHSSKKHLVQSEYEDNMILYIQNILCCLFFSLLTAKNFHKFELGAIANLCPESADEAKALIPRYTPIQCFFNSKIICKFGDSIMDLSLFASLHVGCKRSRHPVIHVSLSLVQR